ncbi:MAG: hypothetical protein LBG80_17365 [Bacteroidales bacterium]|nr:hypothetical protein [Bacteroidales bacterium]
MLVYYYRESQAYNAAFRLYVGITEHRVGITEHHVGITKHHVGITKHHIGDFLQDIRKILFYDFINKIAVSMSWLPIMQILIESKNKL